MSRKSFQRVTLSVELTLPPGASCARGMKYVQEILINPPAAYIDNKDPMASLAYNQVVVKILKRETIYTN